MIGNDFVPQTSKHTRRCSECGKKIKVGTQALVSIRGGRVRKVVCSENCRLTFDDLYWQAIAEERERR